MNKANFYRLNHEEYLSLRSKLKPSELDVYLYLVTKNPFEDSKIEIDTAIISEQLGHHRRTVQIAIRKFIDLELLQVEITKFRYQLAKHGNLGQPSSKKKTRDAEKKIRMMNEELQEQPSNFSVSTQPEVCKSEESPLLNEVSIKEKIRESVDRQGESVDRQGESVDRQGESVDRHCESVDRHCVPEPLPQGDSTTPQTLQTFQNLHTLQKQEREKFLNFCQRKASQFEKPVVLLEKWVNKNFEELYRSYQEVYGERNSSAAPEDCPLLKKAIAAKKEGSIKDVYWSSVWDSYAVVPNQGVPIPINEWIDEVNNS